VSWLERNKVESAKSFSPIRGGVTSRVGITSAAASEHGEAFGVRGMPALSFLEAGCVAALGNRKGSVNEIVI
jgi:hypothetical protein